VGLAAVWPQPKLLPGPSSGAPWGSTPLIASVESITFNNISMWK